MVFLNDISSEEKCFPESMLCHFEAPQMIRGGDYVQHGVVFYPRGQAGPFQELSEAGTALWQCRRTGRG